MMDLVSIGKMVATVGLQGELLCKHGLGKKSDLGGVAVVMLQDRSGSQLPYFVEMAKARSADEVLLKLEGVNTREQATALLHRQVWLKREDFDKHAAGNAPISLLGFVVVEAGKPLGTIKEVIEQPHQLLVTIEMQGKEVLIPLHEESLLGIDKRKKQVVVQLPDGLLELYLG